MTSSTILRTDFRGGGDNRPAAPEDHRPGRLRRLLRQRPPHEIQYAVLEQTLALLESARAELSAGWVQGAWWTTSAERGRQVAMTGLAAGPSTPPHVGAVCLAGAVIRAGARQGRDAEIGRAVDAVYDAMWEYHGQPAAAPTPGPIMVSSPQVRQAKIQTLTRWNDAKGRTGDEVLRVLDGAIARVVQNLASLPAPAGSGRR